MIKVKSIKSIDNFFIMNLSQHRYNNMIEWKEKNEMKRKEQKNSGINVFEGLHIYTIMCTHVTFPSSREIIFESIEN